MIPSLHLFSQGHTGKVHISNDMCNTFVTPIEVDTVYICPKQRPHKTWPFFMIANFHQLHWGREKEKALQCVVSDNRGHQSLASPHCT